MKFWLIKKILRNLQYFIKIICVVILEYNIQKR